LDSAKEIADLLKIKWSIGLTGAVLVANPIPGNEHVSQDVIEQYIRLALDDAGKQKIRGKEITPFLLKHIAEHTKGESLEANIALVLNNARLAARIAVSMVSKVS
jgi:pseudouridine-5'-phosphate glycosidase